MKHWFDGLAMLHRFSFAEGTVSYANRFLQTRAYRAARERGTISYSEFATDPCRSLFQRVTSIFSPQLSDNANVNLVKLGEQFVANSARQNGFIYGLVTAAMALMTGWMASIVFRKD